MAPVQVSRRDFVSAAAGATGIAVFVPSALAKSLGGRMAAVYSGGTFPEGVAAGDPAPTAITLWSRLAGVAGAGSANLEIASDAGFAANRIVKRVSVPADPAKLFVLKARVTGLSPYTQYYYRFKTANKTSPVGRFRTAPDPSSNQTVRFAYFSCQDYTAGYFNAHALMANDNIDFVINLGDFIYETAFQSARAGMVRAGGFKSGTLLQGPVTYEEYCDRYQRYRLDPDLQAMSAKHAMFSTWDDHEVMNDYAGGDPNGGNSARSVSGFTKGWSGSRRTAAYKAFFDNMPTLPQASGSYQLYQKASYGKNFDLWVLDERQYRDKQPCGFKAPDINPVTCTDLNDPRTLLGSAQTGWLQGGLAASTATWKVIANEVVIMSLAGSNGLIESTDDWTAYPQQRESLLSTIKGGGVKNVVFATGDYHTFMAGQVKDAGGAPVATEFAGGSVTQLSNAEISALLGTKGYGSFPNGVTLPAGVKESDYLTRNPHMKEFDQLRHGYVLAEASATQFKATFKKLSTTRSRSTALAATKTYTVNSNSTTIS